MNTFDFLNEQAANLGISALILLLTIILGRWMINLLLGRILIKVTNRTHTTVDDTILQAIRGPLYGLLVVAALQVAIARLDFISDAWRSTFDDVYFVLYVLIGLAAVWRLVNAFADWYSAEIAPRTESNIDDQLIPFARRIALIILGIIAAIILLDRFDIEVGALVTTLGVGSLAIALAAQAALSDTISGFVIMIDRPFRIGDRIELLDLDTWGDVVDIGLRSSRIRTRDNRMVIVPNSVIGKSLIVNHSYPDSQYRIQIHIGLAYGTDIERARQIIVEAVRQVEGVLADHPVEALFLEFGDSALVFRVRWWLESYIDTRRMFDSVNTAIYHALNQAGIEIPFPQADVHHKIDPGDAEHIAGLMRS